MKIKKPELLAPVSNFAMLHSAINAGADAVYFGVKGQNMRLKAGNFDIRDLKKIVDICHKNKPRKVKAYLALNVIIYDSEIAAVKKILNAAKKAKIDAVIAWDFSVICEAKKLKIPLHISTQASISNTQAALFVKSLGAERIVLARELNLKQIKEIKKKAKIQIETFVHGAMCVSISGRCFLSQFTYGQSANKGVCLQPCRRTYHVKDKEDGFEFEVGNDYILSPKDLSALPFLDKLIAAGIDSFKIEGRQKSAEYVYVVIKAYREAIDAYFDNKFDRKLVDRLNQDISKVYNRGFSSGFFMGKPVDEWSGVYGSKATEKKVHLGRIVNFFKKHNVAEINIEANAKLNIGDEIYIIGPTTGTIRQKINEMWWDENRLTKAKQGDSFTIKTNGTVRKNDQVYLIEKVEED